MKMEPIEGSESSAFRTQTPGNYPKENILQEGSRLQNAVTSKVEVKQSLYRAGQVFRFPGDSGYQISWQSAHEGGKVVNPTDRPPLPHKIFLVLVSVRCWGDAGATVKMKNGNDTIGNRTRDLLTCSAVPQPRWCTRDFRLLAVATKTQNRCIFPCRLNT